MCFSLDVCRPFWCQSAALFRWPERPARCAAFAFFSSTRLPDHQSHSMTSSPSSSSSTLKQTHHLIAIALSPQHEEQLIVSTLYLRDSLFVWCGVTDRGAEIQAELAQQAAAASSSTALPPPAQAASADDKLEESALASLSEEDRRQLEVDRKVDEEIAKAMEAAGRSGPADDDASSSTSQPTGHLAREWAMAMHTKAGANTAATSLFRTPADTAAPMARRLAKRLGIPQVHLSLSLPPDFGVNAAAGAGVAGPSPLLSLEKAIEEAVSRNAGGQRS